MTGNRNREGRTYESIGLRPVQIVVLHFEATNNQAHQMAEPA